MMIAASVFQDDLFLSPLQTGAGTEDFYREYDLTVGGEVNIWGRRVIITDCDEFTKHYYRSKYGIGQSSQRAPVGSVGVVYSLISCFLLHYLILTTWGQ